MNLSIFNNINTIHSNSNFQSILHKKIYLQYNQKSNISKNKELEFIKLLIQAYINKNITNSIKLNRTWLCIKIIYNEENDNKENITENTNDNTENLIKLFTIPITITQQIKSYLEKYDKYIEVVNENKDEYLIDLTSYIINNQQENLNDEKKLNIFLQEMKIELEQKFNTTVFIGKGNNILLASLACLKCFIETTKNKNNESITISDISDLFEDNDKSDYLLLVENNQKNILSFTNKFLIEYLSMSDNKYFANFINKKINEKNFPKIKTFGDIINIYYEDIYNIFNKDNTYKDIFLFCLGMGQIFHENQIIRNNGENKNDIKQKSFRNKNKSQIIEIYKKLSEELFKQIYFYQYNPRTLVIMLKDNKNKIYKRITNKETLFDNKESLINIGIKIINQICIDMNENDVKNFIELKIYYDDIVKLDTIKREIWEKAYDDEITEIRIKNSKICYWNNFLNSKSKDESKNKSKSFDIDSKQNIMLNKNSISSKSIKDVNKFSKKANMDLLKLNKNRKKKSKIQQYLLLSQNNKLENFGIGLSKNDKK